MQNRTRITAGCVTGAVTLAILIGLGTIAFCTDHPMTPKIMVLGLIDMFLAMVSVRLLGDAVALASLEEQVEENSTRYVRGVGDTIDRLASVLPQKDNVRRIG